MATKRSTTKNDFAKGNTSKDFRHQYEDSACHRITAKFIEKTIQGEFGIQIKPSTFSFTLDVASSDDTHSILF